MEARNREVDLHTERQTFYDLVLALPCYYYHDYHDSSYDLCCGEGSFMMFIAWGHGHELLNSMFRCELLYFVGR